MSFNSIINRILKRKMKTKKSKNKKEKLLQAVPFLRRFPPLFYLERGTDCTFFFLRKKNFFFLLNTMK